MTDNFYCSFQDIPYNGVIDLEDADNMLRDISFKRKGDIATIQNLPNIFIQGRKVGRIPSSSADVITGDKVGDFNYDLTYIYILVDDGLSGVWRRTSLGAW